MLREPAIHLLMTRDSVTEEKLLYLIKLACRHINRSPRDVDRSRHVARRTSCRGRDP
jgi:hypothetical protein